MKTYLTLIEQLKFEIEKLERENIELKLELKKYELDNINIEELMVDEKLITNKYENIDAINKVLSNFDLPRKKDNAILIVGKDASGSMGLWENNMSSYYTFWFHQLLKKIYPNVSIRYILHGNDAEEVNENEFFYNKSKTGGTICSSAFKTINIIAEEYCYEKDDLYILYNSDGDNLTSDNTRFIKLLERLLGKSKLFVYNEVNLYNRFSVLNNVLEKTNMHLYPNFHSLVINEKLDIYKHIKNLSKKL